MPARPVDLGDQAGADSGRRAAVCQPMRDASVGPDRVDNLERRAAGDQQTAAIAGLAAALAVEDRAIEADAAIERGRDLGLTAPCVGVLAKQLLGHPEVSTNGRRAARGLPNSLEPPPVTPAASAPPPRRSCSWRSSMWRMESASWVGESSTPPCFDVRLGVNFTAADGGQARPARAAGRGDRFHLAAPTIHRSLPELPYSRWPLRLALVVR